MAESTAVYKENDELFDFLRERNIDVTPLIDDKIDIHVLTSMTIEDLRKYIPKYGDILAARDFCNRHRSVASPSGKKSQILTRLRKKLRLQRGLTESESEEDNMTSRSTQLMGNKNAIKNTRYIEIGWLHDSGNGPKQVRVQRGGGTRKLKVSKSSTKEDLCEKAKELFFPSGISKLGRIEEFSVLEMKDFQENPFQGNVGDMYESSKLPLLRFYFCTSRPNDSFSVAESPSTAPSTSTEDEVASSALVLESQVEESVLEQANDSVLTDNTIIYFNVDDNTNYYGDELPDLQVRDFTNLDVLSDAAVEQNSNPASNPAIDTDSIQVLQSQVTLLIHRGNIFQELLEAFDDAAIMYQKIHIKRILPNGEEEMADDFGGVFRDCLSEFWYDFYEKCTSGNDVKIPQLRHDFDAKKWQAVARIICFGWRECGYFPIKLCPIMFEYSVHGEISSDFVTCLMDFIPGHMKDTLKTALESFAEVNSEDLLDVLDTLECKRIMRASNAREILLEIAHKEFIQKPKFILDSWKDIFQNENCLPDAAKLKDIGLYMRLIPTNRRVVEMLNLQSSSPGDSQIFGFLKRYVKELDGRMLQMFVRFCTGSDLLTESSVFVEVIDLEGLARRPVAHTCSTVLKLPRQYPTYLEFRSEFNSTLNSGVWVMDYV